jgi:hypothetical protein
VVGQTGCPDEAGEIVLKNESAYPMTFALRGSAADIKPLDLPVAAGSVAPGAIVKIKVVFDCSQVSSFERVLRFDLLNEVSGKTDSFRVTIVGRIRF